MTTPDVDPFAEDPITRDQYGRPRIIPMKRGKPDLKAKPIGYTRVSTFADAIADAGGLATWRLWHLALGLGRNPDLAALAGTYGPTVDDLSKSDKAELNAIIERAHDRSGGNVKADHGTVIHSLTEPREDGSDPFGVTPDHMAADVAAYKAALDLYGLEVVDSEQFVVNDEVTCAGTYDHRVRTTRPLVFDDGRTVEAGAVLITDKKTGKLHFDSQCIQLAVYANAKTYDPETGVRGELGASFDFGILAHIPKGEGRCDLYLIDLRIGWAAVKLAAKVREHRTRRDIGVKFPTVEPTEPAGDAIAAPAPLAVVETATASDGWDDSPAREAAAAKYDAALAKAHADLKAAQASPLNEEEAMANVVAAFPGAEPVVTIAEKLAGAADRDALSAIWREHKHEWTDEHTAALRARAAELERVAA